MVGHTHTHTVSNAELTFFKVNWRMTKSANVMTESVMTVTILPSVSNTPPMSSAQYCSHLTYSIVHNHTECKLTLDH